MDILPNDILREILDFLDPNWDGYSTTNDWAQQPKCYNTPSDNRRDLSDLANLRLVCKRLNTLAIPYLFRCVVQRFSRRSFRRLECLAEHPELGRHVKKFVYLMPYLYVEGTYDTLPNLYFLCPSLQCNPFPPAPPKKNNERKT